MTPDDDPTRALDDFVRRMRPAPAPEAPAVDLSDLVAKLHPERGVTPQRLRGGVLRNGQRWDADDVEDVPVLEVPRAAPPRHAAPEVALPVVDLQAELAEAARAPEIELPVVDGPPPPDADGLERATRQASEFVASQWDDAALASTRPVWQPDPQALQLRPASHPRLLARWQSGAWIGAVREVMESSTEFVTTANGPAVQTYPPHRLLLAWPPATSDASVLVRWPAQVRLSAVDARDAAAALLEGLPEDALLWLQPDPQAVDWALAADIVLHHEPALRPFQAEGLRAFIAAEREAAFARLNADYHRPVAGAAVLRR